MTLCGCFYQPVPRSKPVYLPRVAIDIRATILSSTARTVFTQTYCNPSEKLIKEASYIFPLHHGVSAVEFHCQVGSRKLHSRVKPRQEAKTEYENAVDTGQSAALMDQTLSATDVFSLKLGNVQPGEKVVVELTVVGDLTQDAQTDGIRYTIPNSIAPRYGVQPDDIQLSSASSTQFEGISITVDVQMEKVAIIREIQSSSHTLNVSLGRISSVSDTTFNPWQASASTKITQDDALLRDFVLLIKADGLDTPRAMLEIHARLPNQRAILTTLVPKFGLPLSKPEMIFVIDRSGSMDDKIATLKTALKVFLKSLPLGVCFNICSFGSSYSFLWDRSRLYDAASLQDALNFVETVDSDMGGTEMQGAVEAAVGGRLPDKELEVLILTDGQIWRQKVLFEFVRRTAADDSARFFSLGIGDAASHSLIEGIARAGNGFSQSVLKYEELDRKVVRMLKGALTPHISDYKLELEYESSEQEEFELVEHEGPTTVPVEMEPKDQQPISLFHPNYTEPEDVDMVDVSNLPHVFPPSIIQAPHEIPPLYPFIRTTAYLLLNPESTHQTPAAVIFKATSKQGPLVLRIPIDNVGKAETIHQLACRKAMLEMETGHGWLGEIDLGHGDGLKNLHDDTALRIIEQQCENLGTRLQVVGRYCSFVALEIDSSSQSEREVESAADIHRSPPLAPTVSEFAPAMRCLQSPNSPFASSSFAAAPPPPCPAPAGFGSGRGGGPRLRTASRSTGIAGDLQDSTADISGASQEVSKVHQIIALQSFEGHWDWTSELMGILEVDEAALRERLARDGDGKYDDKIVVTMLVLAYLRNKCPADRSLWELVYGKAEDWVKQRVAEGKGVSEAMKNDLSGLVFS
ncbi:VIT and vWA domain-containing protein [Aspergillus clavatus NRRL 1]|uniref:von Willebrand domain protein n=1 Tax=Aspergillus clavatus (strain ATCC 1007 / CBS 513.65 / DSM 816 / NCTC 3887 / NRRL 1 / QM 1276 / 107) TaxID=344612 RepID=A1C6V1_ASPCL|nr:von Willebrand domain protein [Aspergillus clavatus NRRL 1]EAW14122.1 von Willebrand domain protein [Aspergillus clavatus NRRL 1]